MSRSKMQFKPIIEDMNSISKEELEARWALWRQGDLSWKLHDCQLPIYDEITNQDNSESTVLASRRTGKSFVILIAEIEICIQNQFAICKHACPTQKMVKEMIYPQLRIIFQDAPPEFNLDEMWNATEGKLKFPHNGSMITIAGTDGNNADNLRGTYMHFGAADEAGFMDNLTYVIQSILRPQALTTGGKIALVSTPNPRILNHEFHTKYVFPAEANGKLVKLTIHDNKRLTKEQIQAEIDSYPLKEKDPAFLVEYMVEIPKVSEASVFPEFSQMKDDIIDDTLELPELCDTYVAGDVGVKDLTAYLFGYYDFEKATLCILDEYISNGLEQTTESIASAIKLKESINFKLGSSIKYPTKRIMDNALQMINDFRKIHGLNFIATKKDNKFGAVNTVRDLLQQGRIKIHPRCKHLIYHMELCKWKDGKGVRAEFDHLPDSSDKLIMGGHADACFVPGTRVLTNLGYKNIEDINPGDLVLTHKGRFRLVLAKMNRTFKGNINNIKFAGKHERIKATTNHPFYLTDFGRTINKDSGFTGQNMPKGDSYFGEISSKIIKNTKAFEPFILENNTEINLSKEMCFLYGYWVAEGSLGGNGSQVGFAGHSKETDVIDILRKAVREHYPAIKGISKKSQKRHELRTHKPLDYDFHFRQTNTNSRVIYVGKKELHKELKVLGKSDYKKFPDIIYSMNQEQILYTLAGYFYGDGCFIDHIKWNTISKNVDDSIHYMLKRIGIKASNIRPTQPRVECFRGKESITKLKYESYITLKQSHKLLNLILSHDDLKHIYEQKTLKLKPLKNSSNYSDEFVKIQEVNEEYYEGRVYNIEVEDDNSYCVEGIAVHNCDSLVYMVRNINFNKNPKNDIDEVEIIGKFGYTKTISKRKELMKKMFNLGRK